MSGTGETTKLASRRRFLKNSLGTLALVPRLQAAPGDSPSANATPDGTAEPLPGELGYRDRGSYGSIAATDDN